MDRRSQSCADIDLDLYLEPESGPTNSEYESKFQVSIFYSPEDEVYNLAGMKITLLNSHNKERAVCVCIRISHNNKTSSYL